MKRLINVLTVVVYLLSLVAISTGEVKAAEATSKVKHKQIKYFVPEHRIIVNAEVSDPNGVKLVRCYFKASAQADYVFVGMQPSSDGNYQGILPAPDKNTQTIEYLFLVLNNKKQVVKTQKFTVAKKDSKDVPSWQNVGSEGNIQVSTEVPAASETLTGFKDSIAIDLVESSARLGLVAGGIYAVNATSAGGAAATSAGTIAASTGSMSTILMVGGVVALGGVVAVGVNTYNDAKDTLNCDKPFTITFHSSECPNYDGIIIRTRNSGGECTYDVINNNKNVSVPNYGRVEYSGNTSGTITLYDSNGKKFLWGDVDLELLSGDIDGNGEWQHGQCRGTWNGSN